MLGLHLCYAQRNGSNKQQNKQANVAGNCGYSIVAACKERGKGRENMSEREIERKRDREREGRRATVGQSNVLWAGLSQLIKSLINQRKKILTCDLRIMIYVLHY